MCLAIPGQVVKLSEGRAVVSIDGVTCEAGLAIAEDIAPGDYVIIHAGYILQKLSEDDARAELDAIRAAVIDPETIAQ